MRFKHLANSNHATNFKLCFRILLVKNKRKLIYLSMKLMTIHSMYETIII